jgi:hypothetical protein
LVEKNALSKSMKSTSGILFRLSWRWWKILIRFWALFGTQREKFLRKHLIYNLKEFFKFKCELILLLIRMIYY